jgi:hypothetical protein
MSRATLPSTLRGFIAGGAALCAAFSILGVFAIAGQTLSVMEMNITITRANRRSVDHCFQCHMDEKNRKGVCGSTSDAAAQGANRAVLPLCPANRSRA